MRRERELTRTGRQGIDPPPPSSTLHSVHKSTISPSGSDLCPVRDTCNWGTVSLQLLSEVCAVDVSTDVSFVCCTALADKSLVTLVRSFVFSSSFLSGEVSLSIERVER